MTQTAIFLATMGFIAGFVDSIAGGGGLITIPTLMTIGMPPHILLGTNKLAATMGSFNAARIFIKKKILNPRLWIACIIATAIGALIGVLINYLLSPDFLKKFLPVLIIGIAIYISIFKPDVHRDYHQFKNFNPPKKSSVLIGTILGGYDGCFGPGTGSFWTASVMGIYKMDLLTASGIARVMNFVSNISALITFILLKNIHYSYGFMMGAGLFLGSHVGAHSSIKFGAKFIRPIFLTVVILIAGKIIWQTYV